MLMLTARGRPEDVLEGFAAGADDYLPKPFELPIFLARLQGLLRRSAWLSRRPQQPNSRERARGKCCSGRWPDEDERFSFNGKTIDFGTLELRTNGSTIHLTLMEAKLLRHLIHSSRANRIAQIHPGRCLGPARGYRHARHRQFHRSPAALYRGGSFEAAAPADRARRGLSLRRVKIECCRNRSPSSFSFVISSPDS